MKILDFALIVGKLKKLKRTGWVNYDVPNPESVADHTLRLAMLAMVLAPKVGANTDKAIKMALIHDLAESTTGDIVIQRGAESLNSQIDKERAERSALTDILSLVDADQYNELFDEYLANQTIEARLIHQLDKLEMAIQAYEYEKEHGVDLGEFFESAHSIVRDNYLLDILSEIEKLRK